VGMPEPVFFQGAGIEFDNEIVYSPLRTTHSDGRE